MLTAEAQPIYRTIADDLRSRIVSGDLAVGEQIPTEADLCAIYGVSRMTVRQALSSLSASGYLVGRRGKGTFVASNKAERSASRLLGFEEDTRNRGLDPATRVLSTEWREADSEAQLLLDCPPGTRLLSVERLRTVNGEPIGINHVLLLEQWAGRLVGEDLGGSLYAIIRRVVADEVAMADQRIEAVQATGEQAELLAIEPGAPLLRIVRATYTHDHGLIGLTRTFYRGDRYYLSLTVNRHAFDRGGEH